MTEWTTIRVRQDAKDDAQERKPDDMTWSEWVRRDDYDPDVSVTVDTDAVVNDLLAELPPRIADELRA
jgi:hypothetical protein